MNKKLFGLIMISAVVQSAGVLAEPGTWWDVTSKMEMEGMPFAMPAQTMEVCIPKGKEGDPGYSQSKDSKCKMTDVKKSGNKMTFKGSCTRDGETMNMSGETVFDSNSIKTNMKMSGTSGGRQMNMSMVSTGKNKGESCDTSQKDRKLQAKIDQGNAQNESNCEDTLAKGGVAVIRSSDNFIGKDYSGGQNIMRFGCLHKKAEFCSVIKRDLPKDESVFLALQEQGKQAQQSGGNSAVKACNIDMQNAPKFYCKQKAEKGPLKYLMKYCPTEAKAYRETLRVQCGERTFSGAKLNSRQMEQCMNEEELVYEGDNKKQASAKRSASASGKANEEASSAAKDEAQSDATSEALKQGGKALKGLFGF